RYDDNNVTALNSPCRRAIQANLTGFSFALNGISVKPFAIVHINDIYPLAYHNSGRLQQILVNGNASYIIKIRFGYPDTVDLGFKNFNKHSANLLIIINIIPNGILS